MGPIDLTGDFTLEADTIGGCEVWTSNLINGLLNHSSYFLTHQVLYDKERFKYLHGQYEMKFGVVLMFYSLSALRSVIENMILKSLPIHISGTFKARFTYTDASNNITGMEFKFTV